MSEMIAVVLVLVLIHCRAALFAVECAVVASFFSASVPFLVHFFVHLRSPHRWRPRNLVLVLSQAAVLLLGCGVAWYRNAELASLVPLSCASRGKRDSGNCKSSFRVNRSTLDQDLRQ